MKGHALLPLAALGFISLAASEGSLAQSTDETTVDSASVSLVNPEIWEDRSSRVPWRSKTITSMMSRSSADGIGDPCRYPSQGLTGFMVHEEGLIAASLSESHDSNPTCIGPFSIHSRDSVVFHGS